MERATTLLITLIIILAGIITLQVFLSKQQGKKGLILPIISLSISIIAISGYAMFAILTPNDSSSIIMSTIMMFFILNIPTVILFAIYLIFSKKRAEDNAMKKMKIKDL